MTGAFRMQVEDIFHIGDKTIFVGQVETSANYINEPRCKIIIDGFERGHLTIQGEVFSSGKSIDVWTRDKLPFERQTLESHQVWLVSESIQARTASRK